MLVGYARTSTADQHAGLEAQERDLRTAEAEKVFSEQVSSVASRSGLRACLDFLRDGDALMVTKPDRLARSTAELLAIEADLTRRGIGLIVLSMGGERLDTRNPTSRLMLTILAGVATWEREVMLERQREGIAKAKAEKRYKGRKPTVAVQADQIRALRAAGEKPAHIAKKLGVARSSIYRMLGERGERAQPAGLKGGSSITAGRSGRTAVPTGRSRSERVYSAGIPPLHCLCRPRHARGILISTEELTAGVPVPARARRDDARPGAPKILEIGSHCH